MKRLVFLFTLLISINTALAMPEINSYKQKNACDCVDCNFSSVNYQKLSLEKYANKKSIPVCRFDDSLFTNANFSHSTFCIGRYDGVHSPTPISLRNTEITNSNFADSRFCHANIKNSRIMNSNFENNYFWFTDFSAGDIQNTAFTNITLGTTARGIPWFALKLNNTHITNSNFEKINQNGKISHIEFQRAAIKNSNFSHSQLAQSDFSRAHIINSIMNNVNLANSAFNHSQLIGVQLTNSIIYKTNWRHSHLNNVNFNHSVLVDVDFNQSQLQQVNFKNTVLCRVTMPDGKLVNSISLNKPLHSRWLNYINFTGCDLHDLHINQSQLTEDNFAKANLTNSQFDHVLMTMASNTFNHSNLNHADFSNAHLVWYRLDKNLSQAFAGADLSNANFANTQFGYFKFDESAPNSIKPIKKAISVDAIFAKAKLCHTVLPGGQSSDRDCS